MKRNDIIAGTDYATKETSYRSAKRVRVISTEKGAKFVRWEGDQTNTVLVQEILTRMTYAQLDGVDLRDAEGKRIETGMQEVEYGDPYRIQLSKIEQPWDDHVKQVEARRASIERSRIAMEARKTENVALFESTKDRVKPWFDFGFIHPNTVTESKIGSFTPEQWRQIVTMVDMLIEASMERVSFNA